MIFFRDIPPVCLTVLRRRGGGLDRAGRILPGQRAEAERAVRPAGDGAEHIHAGRLGHDHGAEQKRGQQGRRRGDPEQCAQADPAPPGGAPAGDLSGGPLYPGLEPGIGGPGVRVVRHGRLSVQGVQIRVDYGGVVFRLRHGLQGGLQFPLQLGGRHGIQPLG